VHGLFSLEIVSFVVWSFLILWSPICLFFLLVAGLLGFYYGSTCLYLLVPECFLLLPVLTSEFWVCY
jgi:hypothetical protein